MAKPGPKPKPTELKVLEGNRGHRPLDLSSMFRPEVGLPDAPKWLTVGAKKAWRRISAELLHYNLLSKIDRDAFAMLCQTVGRLELLETSLSKRQAALISEDKDPADAYFDTTPNGLRIQSAMYQVLTREQDKLHRQLECFGMRPDARAKVTTAIRAQLPLFDVNAGKPEAPAAPNPSQPPSSFADWS